MDHLVVNSHFAPLHSVPAGGNGNQTTPITVPPLSSPIVLVSLTPDQLSTVQSNPSALSTILSGTTNLISINPVTAIEPTQNGFVKRVPPKKNYRQRGAAELPRWRGKSSDELVEGCTWRDVMVLFERYAQDHNSGEVDLADFARSGALPVKIRKKGLFKCGLEFCCREWCKADILYWTGKKSIFASNYRWKLPPDLDNFVSSYESGDEVITNHIEHSASLTSDDDISITEATPSKLSKSESASNLSLGEEQSELRNSTKRKSKGAKQLQYEVISRDSSKGSIWWKLLKRGQRLGYWHSLNTIRGEKFEGDMLESIREFERWCDENPDQWRKFDVSNSTNPEDHVPDPERIIEKRSLSQDYSLQDVKKLKILVDSTETQKETSAGKDVLKVDGL
eukprot:TRINITY_DN1850_c0_g1_i1.p1 TRINITY_DN1850_c0_g1~~TRINITY_DN1850_c0_g1_i1.p1  ORF type:complete len:394 (-),score=69.84 TRINITY_DN1850_c0_g1_i1:162-1343(-)